MTTGTRQTPLLDAHRKLGARLTEFAGWAMPLHYQGVIAEHTAVRQSCGLFDVSHLGKLRLRGPDAGSALQQTVTCDAAGLEVGSAAYGLVLTEEGGCVDDVFVYRLGPEDWLVVPNAANVGSVADMLTDSGGEPTDEWDRWAILALQGPESFEVFGKVFSASDAVQLKLHRWTELDVFGRSGVVARTGYTGERGFEIYAPSEVAVQTFESLLGAGAVPVGLGARDTLRLEMGYALYGHELDLDTNPIEAGLGWAVAWDTDFRGKDALLRVKEQGPAKKLFALRLRDRGVPRPGYPVLRKHDDTRIGRVVSGNHSPTLGVGIALGYAPVGDVPAVGDEVFVAARGRLLAGDIVKPPFIERPGKSK
jgi:aminomethyltransferase